MEGILEFIGDIAPLVLSSLVSIVAILVTAYQTRSQERGKLIEFYLNTQLEAYNNLFSAATDLQCRLKPGEERDVRALMAAGEKAMLVSTKENAEAICDFCTVHIDLVNALDSGDLSDELTEKFGLARYELRNKLRTELFRFDTMRRKSKNRFCNQN